MALWEEWVHGSWLHLLRSTWRYGPAHLRVSLPVGPEPDLRVGRKVLGLSGNESGSEPVDVGPRSDLSVMKPVGLGAIPARPVWVTTPRGIVTWLILPVVICLSQRLSHACLSINEFIL